MISGIMNRMLNNEWKINGIPLPRLCTTPGNSIKIPDTQAFYNARIAERKLLLFSVPKLDGSCGNSILGNFDYFDASCNPSQQPKYGAYTSVSQLKMNC